MCSQVVMLSLILFLTDAVVPYPQVDGMANQSVTLPCTYSVTRNRGVTSMCWGRGACPMSSCADNLIWTNGYRVTYQRQPRYKLKGQIAQGNVSLTIEEATEADSGLYCCRVELRGWFNDQKITLSLKVHPAPLMVTTVATTTRVPTTTTPTMTTIMHTEERIFNTTVIPTTTYAQTHKTDFPPQMESTSSIIPTQVAASSPILTSAAKPQPTTLPETETQTSSSPLPSGPTDGNDTMTQCSDGSLWYTNQTLLPARRQWMTTTSGFLTGTVISSLLLFILATLVMTRYFHIRKRKSISLVAFKALPIGALHNAAERKTQAEDNVYIIEEDNPYVLG